MSDTWGGCWEGVAAPGLVRVGDVGFGARAGHAGLDGEHLWAGAGEAVFSLNCWIHGFSASCWACLWGAGPGKGLPGPRTHALGRSRALCWAPGNQPVSQGKQEEDAVVEKLNLFLDLLQSYKVSLGSPACSRVHVCMSLRECVHMYVRV